MKISLGQNLDVLGINRRRKENLSEKSKIFEGLTTGQRINKASDDAAGAAVADSLKSSGNVYGKARSNISAGATLFNIAAEGLNQLSDILTRIQGLALEASSESVSYRKRQALDDEAQSLATEFTRIISSTEFNSIQLINSSTQKLTLQTGDSTQSIIEQDIAEVQDIPNSTVDLISYEPNGSFDPVSKTTLTGTTADGLQLFDVNGDGNLDSVIADENNVTIALGDGNGSFSISNSYSTGFFGFNLSLGDFNNDGNIDIVKSGGDGVNSFGAVLLGAGDGTFTINSVFTTEGKQSYGSTVADLDSDGNLDIITSGRSNANTGTINVFFGDGSGSFSARDTYAMHTSTSREVKVGDVNGDSFLDIVSVGYDGSNGKVSIRLGDGSGNFGALTTYSADTRASFGLQLEDLDNDGALDIITSGWSDALIGSASILMGVGDGTFQNATNYNQTGSFNTTLVLADFDSDNNLDLITSLSGASGGYSIRFGDGTGLFGARTGYTFGNQTNALAVGDVNSDGAIDLVSVGFEDDPGQVAKLAVNISQTTEVITQVSNFSLLSVESAVATYESVSSLKDSVEQEIAKVDGFLSRLKSAYRDLDSKVSNFDYAESRIRDYELANKTSKITKLEIISDRATAVLAQANQDPAKVLALLESDVTSLKSETD